MLNKLKHAFVNWGLSHILKAPMVEDLLEGLTPEDRSKHALAAKELLENETLQYTFKLMDQVAINKMARESNTSIEMLFGKALIFYVMTHKSKLKEMSNYKAPTTTEPKKW